MSKNCELVDLVVSMLSERIKVCDVVRMEVSEKRSVARRCGSMLLFGVLGGIGTSNLIILVYLWLKTVVFVCLNGLWSLMFAQETLLNLVDTRILL